VVTPFILRQSATVMIWLQIREEFWPLSSTQHNPNSTLVQAADSHNPAWLFPTCYTTQKVLLVQIYVAAYCHYFWSVWQPQQQAENQSKVVPRVEMVTLSAFNVRQVAYVTLSRRLHINPITQVSYNLYHAGCI